MYHQMTEGYGENFMSVSKVRKWCREFSDGRTNIHDENRSGQPSLVTDDLEQHVDDLNRLFTKSELSDNFSETSRTVLYKILTELRYHKICAR